MEMLASQYDMQWKLNHKIKLFRSFYNFIRWIYSYLYYLLSEDLIFSALNNLLNVGLSQTTSRSIVRLPMVIHTNHPWEIF
jgi:hypothetical protein